MQFKSTVLASLSALALLVSVAGRAYANFDVCNHTTVEANVAILYGEHVEGSAQAVWYTKGWFVISPNKCQVVYEGVMSEIATLFGVYAVASDDSWIYSGDAYAFVSTRSFQLPVELSNGTLSEPSYDPPSGAPWFPVPFKMIDTEWKPFKLNIY